MRPASYRAPDRIGLRGGVGPEQPEWDDVQLHSAEWWRRFRAWHKRTFPDVDAGTRANLNMLVARAEELEAAA